MNQRNMRAGERRKLARNLEFNRTARTIGVVGFSFAQLVLPVLVLLGLAATAALYSPHHSTGVLLAAAPVIGVGGDFLKVMEESDKHYQSVDARAKRVEKFEEKLVKFMGLITNADGMRQRRRAAMMEEAETTADFPILFGTVLERTLIARYKTQASDWRTYIKVGTQNDFRVNNIIGIFGLESALGKVKERGEYPNDFLADGKVQNQLYKYGRQFQLSWEALINDDLGAFNDCAARLSNAALVTEYFESTKLFCGATGPIASLYGTPVANLIDAQNVTNLVTDVFSADALALAVTAMRKQKDINGNPIVVDRFHLVVGPDLEVPALKALSQSALIAGGGTTGVVTSENIVAKFPITLHVNPYIPLIATTGTYGAKSWWLFAENGGNIPAVQMNFLRGHENPEVVQRMSNKVTLGGGTMSQMEGDFESDSMAWRLRHVLGGTQVDNRFTYASNGQG